jgi:pimeloyl-ACP methyl ester carboxylesterase
MANRRWLLLLTLVSWASAMSAATAQELTWKPYRFEPADASPVDAEMGTFSVPLSRSRPDSGRLKLSVVRFRSTAAAPGPPILYLAGGPGGSAIETARGPRFPYFMALREAADVLVLDQRGTGLSAPLVILCRESWTLPVDRPGDREEMLAPAKSHSESCAALLARNGTRVADYNSDESADDVEDLRKALGVPRLSIWGVSYGTQLALDLVRRHPGTVHRMALVGVEGPDHTLRLPADAEAHLRTVGRLAGEVVPDLPGLLRSLLDKLGAQPVEVEVFDRFAGRKVKVRAGRFDLQLMTAQALGSLEGIRGLPANLLAMSRGDFSSLGESVYRRRKGWLGSALPYAVNCASGVSPERWQRILAQEKETLLGRAMDFPFPEICDGWRVPDLGPAYRAPVRSDVPTLFVGGTLDMRTPVSNMEETAAGFPNGERLVVERGGHGDDLLLNVPELPQRLRAFFQGAAPGPARITIPPLRFRATPGHAGETPAGAGEAPRGSGDTPGSAGKAPRQSGKAPRQSGETP